MISNTDKTLSEIKSWKKDVDEKFEQQNVNDDDDQE